MLGKSLLKASWVSVLSAVCMAAGAQSSFGAGSQPPSLATPETLPDAPQPQTAQKAATDEVTLHNTPANILADQAAIWSSPVRLRPNDLKWTVPLLLATGAAIATDHQALSSLVSHDRAFNHSNVLASDVLTGVFIAAPVAIFSKGQVDGDQVSRQNGILGGEALVDGLVVQQGMKLIFWRERPDVNHGRGKFFQSDAGLDSSFPSSHSLISWSSAAVLADEYKSPWARAGIYTFAAGVSLTRVMGQQHFPSDVLVGSAVGWLVGHYVCRKHYRGSIK
jgi:hypothetical protein